MPEINRQSSRHRCLPSGQQLESHSSSRLYSTGKRSKIYPGPPNGGRPIIASIMETAKLNGINPQAYLADVITRIVKGHPQSQIDDLLPWAYLPAPLKAVA